VTRLHRRHILMTTDAVGGVWQYSANLAAELAEAGSEVSLTMIGPPPDAAQRACLEGHQGVRLVQTGLPLDWLCRDASQVRMAAEKLAGLALACGADLVHCNSPALAGAAAFPVPVLAVAHGCIATWWEATRGGPVEPDLRWHGELMRRGLMRADAVAAPSASFAAALRATYGLARPVEVVFNGRPAVASARGDAPPVNAALTVGRMWDPAKNAALLDQVARRIDLRLLAAGALHGPNGESVALSHAVALGQVPEDDLAALLARQPIFVSAAMFEPFGLAVLEAASAGCALVLSDIPTFRELWDGAALFADPGDVDGFAAAINHLHADVGLRERIGRAARARAARYTPHATARAIMAIYAALLAGREVAA